MSLLVGCVSCAHIGDGETHERLLINAITQPVCYMSIADARKLHRKCRYGTEWPTTVTVVSASEDAVLVFTTTVTVVSCPALSSR